jgi:hypothetical protein
MKNFFWKEASGIKADIARHRTKEQEIRAKIVELEASNRRP